MWVWVLMVTVFWVETLVTAAFIWTRYSSLEAIAVSLLTLRLFTSAEYRPCQLQVLSIFESTNENIALGILSLVFAVSASTLWTTCLSILQTLAVKFKAVGWFTCTCDNFAFFFCNYKGLIDCIVMISKLWTCMWRQLHFFQLLLFLHSLISYWSFILFILIAFVEAWPCFLVTLNEWRGGSLLQSGRCGTSLEFYSWNSVIA